jgi:tRNA nucleotidyltransferase (CCA-adding enzyme)
VPTWSEQALERLRSPRLDALASEPGVWVVGGAVRDALLGREPRELDLVVEGDAQALARRLGDRVTLHDRFGTATVDGMDLATARTETYAHPGALPDVRPATMEEDLARRDFTVNALAVRLADGVGLAAPGALEDLEAGVLRVLHSRSFEDDPTRLLRLARYAGRLGLAADPGTDRLARAAIDGGATGTVTPGRLGSELRLLAAEPQPAALVALADRGLGEAILGRGFAVDPALTSRVLAETPAGARADLAVLGAALLDAPGLRERLDELAFPAAERDVVLRAAAARALARDLAADPAPSAVGRRARREPPEALAVAAALGAPPAAWWLAEGRDVRLRITGDDLLAAGLSGPAVGAGLDAALAAVLDGRAATRDDELREALGRVKPR